MEYQNIKPEIIVFSNTESNLLNWNLAMMILHFVQGLIAFICSFVIEKINNFTIPLSTIFLNYDRQNGVVRPYQQVSQVWDFPFATFTSFFALMSAFAHMIVLLNKERYITDLRKGINYFRWYEYSISSSLMIVLIAMLFGMYDVVSLILLASVNACMNLFGLLQEKINLGQTDKTFLPFWYGCFAGLIPWIVIFTYLGGSYTSDIPNFVWAILFSYLIFFNTFPINMYCQYAQVGKWNNAEYSEQQNGGYMYGEKLYQIQSLVSKSFLLWLVIGGVNQPNAKT